MTAGLELLDLRDRRVRRATRVKLVLLAPLEMTGNTAPEDRQGLKVKRESLGSKEDPDQGARLVWRDPKAILELLASPGTQGSRARAVLRENLAILVTMEGRETEASRATPALLVSQGYKDLLGNL